MARWEYQEYEQERAERRAHNFDQRTSPREKVKAKVEEAVDKDLSKDLPSGGTFPKSPEEKTSQDQGSERRRPVSIYFGERRPIRLDCGMVFYICLWP